MLRRYAVPSLFRSLLLVPLLLSSPSPAHALDFTFTPSAGMSQQAQDAFAEAGARWSALFNDNVTVNIDIDFTALGSGILGQAGSTRVTNSYSSHTAALLADRSTANDATAVSSLQTGSAVDLLINRTSNSPFGRGSATPYLDDNGNTNNTTIRMTLANARALGLWAASDSITDASIAFSTSFTWDFDPSDGITAGAFDFVGVATHEIGHALGFISGVDILDLNSSGRFFNDRSFSYVSPLDLYRYSADSLALGVIDWTADTRWKYFSIDGGLTDLGGFATGQVWGDGRQASHFKDGMGIGIMDPTSGGGELLAITEQDIVAFDTIGWNRNPDSSLPTVSAQSGSWHDSYRWDNGIPTLNDALIDNADTRTIGADAQAATLFVGVISSGSVIQTAGATMLAADLVLGVDPGSNGSYTLQAGSLSAVWQYVGFQGSGTFAQADGSNSASFALAVASEVGSSGSYTLQAGSLTTLYTGIGLAGTGQFIQTGAVHTVTGGLFVGFDATGNGSYTLQTGDLTSPNQYIGYDGVGTFTQSGGTNTSAGELSIGHNAGSNGTYTLQGGTVATVWTRVGYQGAGVMIQSGGTQTLSQWLVAGRLVGSDGQFELQGGTLTTDGEYIGAAGTGRLIQSGGTNQVSNELVLGYFAGSSGTATFSGGTLQTPTLRVGREGSGALNLASTAASLTITQTFAFGANSSLTAVAGSRVHMVGANFENQNTAASSLAGLGTLTLQFEGGAGVTSLLELAGNSGAGFTNNFALGGLTLGGADLGWVQLVDQFDNTLSSVLGDEALFTQSLLIGVGSFLDLNGLDLYVSGDQTISLDGWLLSGALLDTTLAPSDSLAAVYDGGNNWTTLQVIPGSPLLAMSGFAMAGSSITVSNPEPGTLALMATGLLAVGSRLRNRRRRS